MRTAAEAALLSRPSWREVVQREAGRGGRRSRHGLLGLLVSGIERCQGRASERRPDEFRSFGNGFPKERFRSWSWIVSAISAGIVEEVIFRGYLMKQLAFLSRSTGVGLVLQAVLFGVAHGFYLGMRQVILIAVSGILIGVFALWRKNLRSAMVFHAWADIFGAILVRGLPFQ